MCQRALTLSERKLVRKWAWLDNHKQLRTGVGWSPSPRKLTLEGLSWTVFDKDEDRDTAGRQFVQLIQDLLTKPVGETAEASIQPTLESAPTGAQEALL